MHHLAKFLMFMCIGISVQSVTDAAHADLLITVDKSAQRLAVIIDGAQRYTWPISTGLDGGPPSGAFRPERLERMWYSRKYDWSPMPHAIFFYRGYAIHGTGYVAKLGNPASHGCVRLHPEHAATLFGLVKTYGAKRTEIEISGSSRAVRGSSPSMAQAASANAYATAPGYVKSRY